MSGVNKAGNLRGMNHPSQRIAEAHKRMEEVRCQFEATLSVLSARIGGAKDSEDWATLMTQTRDLFLLSQKARRHALAAESTNGVAQTT